MSFESDLLSVNVPPESLPGGCDRGSFFEYSNTKERENPQHFTQKSVGICEISSESLGCFGWLPLSKWQRFAT